MLHQISASAGSGKTHALTKHFLELLALASPEASRTLCSLRHSQQAFFLDELLAATFTNKAAAEMKARVLGNLKKLALEQTRQSGSMHEPARNQGKESLKAIHPEQWIKIILQNDNALNIRTIDSLLFSLVRMSALSLKLAPNFQPSFTPEEFFTPVYEAYLADLAPEEENGLAPLPLDSRTKQARVLFQQACLHHIRFGQSKGYAPQSSFHAALLPLIERLCKGEVIPELDETFLHEELHTVHQNLLSETAALLAALEEDDLATHKNFSFFLEKILSSSAYAPPPNSTFIQKTNIAQCLLAQCKERASQLLQEQYQKFQRRYQQYGTAHSILLQAIRLRPLCLLAQELFPRLHESSVKNGLLPAARIPYLASLLLRGETAISEALCRMGNRLQHILLDEFQDTSQAQWSALLPLIQEALATGGSFTYVGDVKQAIYNWRGGDVTLFDLALKEKKLTAIAPATQKSTLPFNWRSCPELVAHNNFFFSRLRDPALAKAVLTAMLPDSTPEEWIEQAAGQARHIFKNCEQELPPKSTFTAKGRVCFYEMESGRPEEKDRLIEQRLLQLLEEELLKKFQYKDIAVLARSGQQTEQLATWLSKRGLPVFTENSFLLTEHPLISRLIAWLHFLDYPLNDLSFWEFISSTECFIPISGLQTAILELWLLECRETRPETPLYLCFQQTFPGQWEEWIQPFHDQAGFMSAYDILFESIRHFQLTARQSGASPFIRRLLELAHLAEARGISSLAGFLELWEQKANQIKVPLPEGMDAIRVMTIHKAKGLEFPALIVPFHGGGKAYQMQLTLCDYKGKKLLAKPDKLTPELYYPACITEALENLNLLYVAWTRPRQELHAFIDSTPSSQPGTPLNKGLRILFAFYRQTAPPELFQHEILTSPERERGTRDQEKIRTLQKRLESKGRTEEKFQEPLKSAASYRSPLPPEQKNTPDSRQLPRVKAEEGWSPMQWLPHLRIHRPELPGPTFTAEQRGNLLHAALEHLTLPLAASQPPGLSKQEETAAINQALDAAFKQLPIFFQEQEKIKEAAWQPLAWFCSLPQTPAWLQNGQREQVVRDCHGQLLRIDLLLDEKNAGLLALEYKTGQARPEHQEQLLNYLALLKTAQEKPVRGLLVYLDLQILQEITL